MDTSRHVGAKFQARKPLQACLLCLNLWPPLLHLLARLVVCRRFLRSVIPDGQSASKRILLVHHDGGVATCFNTIADMMADGKVLR